MNFAVIGHGGHSKVIKDLIESSASNQIIAYLDDKYELLDTILDLYMGPVHSIHFILNQFPDVKIVLAIGNNAARKAIVENLTLPEDHYCTLISDQAVISPGARIDVGSVIMPGAIINSDSKVGKHVIVNTGAIIDHDCRVGDYAHVSPKGCLTGSVTLEEGVLVGAGATVIPEIKIGKWSCIGAGATVVKDVPDYCRAVGVPARVTEIKEGGGTIADGG
jgi:acetyltransferase EpsM